jgi:hypothetical protein
LRKSDSKVRVTVTQDGPYMVTGGVKLSEQIIATGSRWIIGGLDREGVAASHAQVCAVSVRAFRQEAVLRRLPHKDRL